MRFNPPSLRACIPHFYQSEVKKRARPRHRLHVWFLFLAMLLGLFISTAGVSSAFAASKASSPQPVLHSHHGMKEHAAKGSGTHTASNSNSPCAPSYCGTPPLVYKGGPVQHNPRVFLVFWGSNWTVTDPIIQAAKNLFNNLAGGDFNNALAQYGDTQDFVHNDVSLAGTWIDTTNSVPSGVTRLQIATEAVNAIQANNWSNTADTQVMVFPQQGTTYDSSIANECGEHEYATYGSTNTVLVFSLILYSSDVPNSGCDWGGGSTANNMTKVEAHEYAETANDPQLNGWQTSDGFEVGDLCNYDFTNNVPGPYNFFYAPINGPGSLYVQELWDNQANACVTQHGQEYLSPTAPRHTVQGAILNVYQNAGQSSGPLGEPTTEETPIVSGRVSYFAGQNCNGGGPNSSGSAIYWSPSTGAYSVQGCIYADYIAASGPAGALSFPVTSEQGVGNGRVSYFEGQSCNGGGPNGSGSAIFWSSSTSAHEVQGCIYQVYEAVGGAGGALGFPVADEQGVGSGRVSYFAGQRCGSGGPDGSGSAVFWSPSTSAHEVQGCIYQVYEAVGGAGGALGFPVADEQGNWASQYRMSIRTLQVFGNLTSSMVLLYGRTELLWSVAVTN